MTGRCHPHHPTPLPRGSSPSSHSPAFPTDPAGLRDVSEAAGERGDGAAAPWFPSSRREHPGSRSCSTTGSNWLSRRFFPAFIPIIHQPQGKEELTGRGGRASAWQVPGRQRGWHLPSWHRASQGTLRDHWRLVLSTFSEGFLGNKRGIPKFSSIAVNRF